MQSWPAVPSSQSVQTSRADLLARDESVKSNYSGSNAPATNLVVGQFFFDTDDGVLYQLKDTTPTWVKVGDLSKTYISKEMADALYKDIEWLPEAEEIDFDNTGTGLSSTDVQGALEEIASGYYNSWLKVRAVIPSTSNAYGNRTLSTAAPSGGNAGDIWYQY